MEVGGRKGTYLNAWLPADYGEIARSRVGRELDDAVEYIVVGLSPVEVVLLLLLKKTKKRYMIAHTIINEVLAVTYHTIHIFLPHMLITPLPARLVP